MKLLSTLTAAALLTAGAAFAASTTPTATPGAASPANAATVKHSAMHCEKEARAKKLTGDEEKKFVKECREGKKS